MTCDCQGPGCCCGDEEPVTNAPGLSALRWRVAPHGAALRRMRRTLPAPGADDPAAVLLDAWAVVTDVVSFYTERIAQEGFLRTATEGLSVRELARTIGYETRPGVAARTELALDVEEAPGAPATVHVPAGSPVRTIPAPDALPQVFETSAELEAVAAWNAVPALATVPQPLGWSVTDVWLPTLTPGVQVDDRLLVVGAERAGVGPGDPHGPDTERWDLRRVTAVEVAPAAHPGWTRIRLDRRIGFRASTPLVAEDDVQVFRLARRLALFGHDAPDPQMFSADFRPPRVPSGDDWSGLAANSVGPRLVELAGDHPDVVPGSWLVLEQPGLTEAYRVEDATPDGDKRFGLSGRITRLRLDIDENLAGFDRRQTVVHAVSRPLSAAVMPRFDSVGAAPGSSATVLDVAGTTPPLPAGRLVAVTGRTTTGAPGVETAVVVASTALPGGGQRLVLDPALTQAYDAGTVVVRANLVPATHGETVHQVLGSGDGRVAFPRFRLRRGPLTHVRSTTAADGAVADLTVLVEDVAWREVPSLLDAGPHDQVYVLRLDAEGLGTVTFGDGAHGARLPSGTENVRAVYRVGIGPDGAAGTGQVSLPVRRPRGIGTVANLAPARDWAGPEDLGQARVNAPQRIRTLDRAVSVADHADFARAYSGVGRARADLVWDGRADRVVVSVLAADGGPASGALITDLRSTLEDARDRRTPWTVVAGEVVDVAAKLTLDVDPRHERDAVRDAVTAALLDTFGGLDLGAPLAASAVLVAATSVDGVLSATMPVLRGPVGDDALLTAEPARWDTGTRTVRPARALRLVPGLLDVGVRT
ncbi:MULTISPECIES: baseplate J/gp47 family protein [unclassified Isoptericola]|uniref:baseplate J/gp47 family protein n=1 Tax=unclassified Isoptericola TaxID=2623355 RepID=UPI002712CB38|nr:MULTISPECIES: baseplate J/gp47 family protein [unclassified Isoptericola]MDO8144905.1 baseplate J/gp47 family protein [Isoptericola sp. 178]MDO8149684.1 baseplate J/gp47 family protein [Isoptericola sp. b515]